jgi:hypothetical protein
VSGEGEGDTATRVFSRRRGGSAPQMTPTIPAQRRAGRSQAGPERRVAARTARGRPTSWPVMLGLHPRSTPGVVAVPEGRGPSRLAMAAAALVARPGASQGREREPVGCRRTCKNAEITTGRRQCLMSIGTGPAPAGHWTLIAAPDASGLICRGVRPTAGARWTGRHRMHKQLTGQILRRVRNPALSDDSRHSSAPATRLWARRTRASGRNRPARVARPIRSRTRRSPT